MKFIYFFVLAKLLLLLTNTQLASQNLNLNQYRPTQILAHPAMISQEKSRSLSFIYQKRILNPSENRFYTAFASGICPFKTKKGKDRKKIGIHRLGVGFFAFTDWYQDDTNVTNSAIFGAGSINFNWGRSAFLSLGLKVGVMSIRTADLDINSLTFGDQIMDGRVFKEQTDDPFSENITYPVYILGGGFSFEYKVCDNQELRFGLSLEDGLAPKLFSANPFPPQKNAFVEYHWDKLSPMIYYNYNDNYRAFQAGLNIKKILLSNNIHLNVGAWYERQSHNKGRGQNGFMLSLGINLQKPSKDLSTQILTGANPKWVPNGPKTSGVPRQLSWEVGVNLVWPLELDTPEPIFICDNLEGITVGKEKFGVRSINLDSLDLFTGCKNLSNKRENLTLCKILNEVKAYAIQDSTLSLDIEIYYSPERKNEVNKAEDVTKHIESWLLDNVFDQNTKKVTVHNKPIELSQPDQNNQSNIWIIIKNKNTHLK